MKIRQSIIIISILSFVFLITSCEERVKSDNTQNTLVEVNYAARGQELADSAKAELGRNLLSAIQSYGTAGAVDFCNLRAIPLTDSLGRLYSARIRRVSDKPRNTKNKANESELAYIYQSKLKLATAEKISPKVIDSAGKVICYYPIQTNNMCLQCHGSVKSDIMPETHAIITKLYPSDKATGYKANEVRGVWVIEMDKQ